MREPDQLACPELLGQAYEQALERRYGLRPGREGRLEGSREAAQGSQGALGRIVRVQGRHAPSLPPKQGRGNHRDPRTGHR